MVGEDFGDVAAEVGGDGEIVHLGEAFVDADVTEVAIEEAEADGDSVVDGVELGEALGGKASRRSGRLASAAAERSSAEGGRVRRRYVRRRIFGELRGWDGTAVEPALADVATEPEEHVGEGLVFDSFGDGGETEAVAKAYDGGGDLSALSGVVHGANEAGVDLELVEREELKMAETGVAGSEVVERETGALFFELVGDAGGALQCCRRGRSR